VKYESENEKDLKDLQDFPPPDPDHYPPGGGFTKRNILWTYLTKRMLWSMALRLLTRGFIQQQFYCNISVSGGCPH